MKILRVLGILLLLVVIFFAAFNIVDDRCSMALASLDELTWEEMQENVQVERATTQVDFEPGAWKAMK